MTFFLSILVVCILLLIPTAYAGVIGAPYVPVRRLALKKAFDKLNVDPRDTVVDLGAGDGGVVLEAARRGATALGFELSPIMWALAWVRTHIVKGSQPRVLFRNFYTQKLPVETTLIFVFLMPKNLPRLLAFLKQQKLPRAKYVLSYTFALPDIPPSDIIQTPTHGTVYIYRWSQLTGQ